MGTEMEMSLGHDGTRWVARGDSFAVSGRTLADLDAEVADALRAGNCGEGVPVTVAMAFDFAAFPVWMRQYASHYFNRNVTFDL